MIIRYLLAILMLAAAPAFMAGCNTVEGAGRDISGTADWTEDALDLEDDSYADDDFEVEIAD